MTDQANDTTQPKRGLVGPHRESHEPRLAAHALLADGVTPVSGFVEWTGTEVLGEDWGMDHNEEVGCCGPAATDHCNMAKIHSYSAYGQLGMPKFEGTLGTYYAYGRAMGEVGQPPNPPDHPDFGVSNAEWLGFLYRQGVIAGYAEVTDLTTLDWWGQRFGGVITGLIIDGNVASRDFYTTPRTPWDAMGKTDGHDVLYITGHADGSGAFVTWGSVQPFTLAFRQSNITDAWVIFDKYDPSVNWPALEAALAEVHGTFTPPAQTIDHRGIAAWLHRVLGQALARESENLIVSELQALVRAITHNPKL